MRATVTVFGEMRAIQIADTPLNIAGETRFANRAQRLMELVRDSFDLPGIGNAHGGSMDAHGMSRNRAMRELLR